MSRKKRPRANIVGDFASAIRYVPKGSRYACPLTAMPLARLDALIGGLKQSEAALRNAALNGHGWRALSAPSDGAA